MPLDLVTAKCIDRLETAVAAWTLGRVESLDLPRVATAWLAHGHDSPAVQVLAGYTSEDAFQPEVLWQQVLRELACPVLTKESAAVTYAVCVARLIVSSEVRPYEGAKALSRASLAVRDSAFHDLDPFVYAVDEYNERPADRSFFEQAIMAEAHKWAAHG